MNVAEQTADDALASKALVPDGALDVAAMLGRPAGSRVDAMYDGKELRLRWDERPPSWSKIVIPAVVIFVIPQWLAGVGVGGWLLYVAVGTLRDGVHIVGLAMIGFCLFWLAFWLYGGLYSLYRAYWFFFGPQESWIACTEHELVSSSVSLGKKTYQRDKVTDIDHDKRHEDNHLKIALRYQGMLFRNVRRLPSPPEESDQKWVCTLLEQWRGGKLCRLGATRRGEDK